jgi:hypothetical protein
MHGTLAASHLNLQASLLRTLERCTGCRRRGSSRIRGWLAVPITTTAATDRPSAAMRKRRLRRSAPCTPPRPWMRRE